jgi:glutamate N-acetyltransferase/amino-acid N-acetyltransferase
MIMTGGVTSPIGFKAAGAHVGLKRKRKDLAIVLSESPANFAAALTTNVVKAAPILWNQQIVAAGKQIKAVVINSGNANSCTGPTGTLHTEMMAAKTADCLGVKPTEVLVASTGVIGVPLPIEKVEAGIAIVAPQVAASAESGYSAAEAIMTTDSFVKQCALQVKIGATVITIGGMAKGSGMVHPNMATMLSFITTDAAISQELLHKALIKSVSVSYNMISVDGDTSTNDMVAILANGMAGNAMIADADSADYHAFCQALDEVNTFLAKCIASDGEGATKVLTVTVKGSKNIEDAQKLSKSVVSSNLVKTAFFGEDANWGRILAALGYGGVIFDPSKVSIDFVSASGAITLLKSGQPCQFCELTASRILKQKEIEVLIDLDDGSSTATAWGCDLSYDYVRINGAYRT